MHAMFHKVFLLQLAIEPQLMPQTKSTILKPSTSRQSKLQKLVDDDVDEIIRLSREDLKQIDNRSLSEENREKETFVEDDSTRTYGKYSLELGETHLKRRRSKLARQQGFMLSDSNKQINDVFTLSDLQEEMK